MKKMDCLLDSIDIILKAPSNNKQGDTIISQEYLVRKLWEFLSFDYEKGIIFNVGSAFSNTNPARIKELTYTGSDIYLAVLMIFSALENLTRSRMVADTYVENLKIDDTVIYTNLPREQFLFKGIITKDGKEYVKLESNNKSSKSTGTCLIRKDNWNTIIKDNGKSRIATRGRNGLKDYKNLSKFFIECLEYEKNDIPSDTEYSTIFVIDEKAKERTKFINNHVYLRYLDKQGMMSEIPLLDLTNAAFYSNAKNPIYFPGNSNKLEPSLKVTSSLNVASELCSKRFRKKEIARIIVLDSIIEKTKCTGILSLLSGNHKVYLETDYSFISKASDIQSLDSFKENKIKSYIPDGILLDTNNINTVFPSPVTEVLKWQAEDIKNHYIEPIEFNAGITKEEYSELKDFLFKIKYSDVITENKDNYFIKAFYLLKTLSASFLSMNELQESVDIFQVYKDLCNIQLPETKELKTYKYKCEEILKKLIQFRTNDKSRKDKLIAILNEENKKGKEKLTKRTVLIIVHKKYLQESTENLILKFRWNSLIINIDTVGKVRNKTYYDIIIFSDIITNGSINVFDLNFAGRIYVFLSSYKKDEYLLLEKKSKHLKNSWFKTSAFDLAFEYKFDSPIENESTDSDTYLDKDFENIINDIITSASYIYRTAERKIETSAKLFVKFDDDSYALFTEAHKVYVLRQVIDSEEYEVLQIPVERLLDGDDIIFIERHGKMQDAIKIIQNYLIEKNALPKEELEAIQITQKWRQDLYEYVSHRKERHETKKSIAEKCNVSIIEFNNWLDFDFYIVGPDSKSIEPIGRVINYDLMKNNSKLFKDKVETVKRLHTKIRRALGEAIIAKEEGKNPSGEYAQKIFEVIGNLKDIRRVQEIRSINKKVDISIVNHPISY